MAISGSAKLAPENRADSPSRSTSAPAQPAPTQNMDSSVSAKSTPAFRSSRRIESSTGQQLQRRNRDVSRGEHRRARLLLEQATAARHAFVSDD